LIAIDANILVYSHRVDAPFDEAALELVRKQEALVRGQGFQSLRSRALEKSTGLGLTARRPARAQQALS
jgi:hypothetical protein